MTFTEKCGYAHQNSISKSQQFSFRSNITILKLKFDTLKNSGFTKLYDYTQILNLNKLLVHFYNTLLIITIYN